jgi:hypothetical protein
LGEERRLRMFESRVLRVTFGSKRDEVTGEWRKLHNEELFSYTNLCTYIYIIKTLKHFVHLIAPTCFDTQRVIIRELHFPG